MSLKNFSFGMLIAFMDEQKCENLPSPPAFYKSGFEASGSERGFA
jgi:hypothetical protein